MSLQGGIGDAPEALTDGSRCFMGVFGQIVVTFTQSHAERDIERKLKSDCALVRGVTTANYQMLSVCNSAPLFLLARTPG